MQYYHYCNCYCNVFLQLFYIDQDDPAELIIRASYFKKKSQIYHSFCVNDQYLVNLFIKYRAKTRHLWSNENLVHSGRVFWQTRRAKNGVARLHGQALGVKWFYSFTKDIALWLGLDPKNYSGHSVSRTGSTFVGDAGVSLLQLKKYGGWKSDTVAESYYTHSLKNRLKTAALITDAVDLTGEDNDINQDVGDCIATNNDNNVDCIATNNDDNVDCIATNNDNHVDCIATKNNNNMDCVADDSEYDDYSTVAYSAKKDDKSVAGADDDDCFSSRIRRLKDTDIDTTNTIPFKKQKQKQFVQCSFSNCSFNLN